MNDGVSLPSNITEGYLDALALVRNRLGDITPQKDNDFQVLLLGTTREDLISLLSLTASIMAITLEGLGDLYESLTGEEWLIEDSPVELAEQYLDVIVETIINNAVQRAGDATGG